MPTILGVILGEAPGTTRPSRTGLYPLALPGIAVLGIVTLGYRAPIVRRLYPQPLPRAIITDTDLELHLPRIGVRRYQWDEVGELTAPKGHKVGALLSPEGALLAEVPWVLVTGNWRSLAQLVVEVRPERYELVPTTRFGPPTLFRTRTGTGAIAKAKALSAKIE